MSRVNATEKNEMCKWCAGEIWKDGPRRAEKIHAELIIYVSRVSRKKPWLVFSESITCEPSWQQRHCEHSGKHLKRELLIVFSLQSGMIFRSRNSNVHLHICKGKDKRNKSCLKCKLLSTLESFRRSFLGPAFEIATRKPTTTLKIIKIPFS